MVRSLLGFLASSPLSHCHFFFPIVDAYPHLFTTLKIEALINVVASLLIFYFLPTLLDSQFHSNFEFQNVCKESS
ncbi:hypothetical protein HanRHA438_Chr10g0440871 [Helianthus annuus]|nr:hypothetical protein HanRHA438_Chr10g0440871 [Helianthus annuus]